MTGWHQIRRIVAATAAALVASWLSKQGVHVVFAILGGIAAAVIIAGLIIPAVWKPPSIEPLDEDQN